MKTIKARKDEIKYLKYLVKCCENILGKQVVGVGYPEAEEKYGLIPPVLQLMKMRQELEVRISTLKEEK